MIELKIKSIESASNIKTGKMWGIEQVKKLHKFGSNGIAYTLVYIL